MPQPLRVILQEIERRGIPMDQVPQQYRTALEEARRRSIPLGSTPVAPERTMMDKVVGAGDVALTLVGGAANEALRAGPSGILAVGRDIVSRSPNTPSPSFNILGRIAADVATGNDESLIRGAEAVERNRGAVGPLTQTGQESMENLAPIFQGLDRLTKGAGNVVQDTTGSTILATITKSLLDLLPVSMTGRRPKVDGTPITLDQRARDITELRQVAERQGVDLGATRNAQIGQIVDTANKRVGGQVSTGQDFGDIQSAVVNARRAENEIVDALYEKARETGDSASIYQADFKPLSDAINKTMKAFILDVPEMARVRENLKHLNEMMTRNPNDIVTMNEVADFQKRLNNRSNDPSANGANAAMAVHTKTWLQSLFDRDMISGDPQAVTNWRMANTAYSEFKATFDDNTTIRRLHEQEATPEQVKNWILGTNSVGAKKEAALTVEGIAKIVGKDSREFQILQQEIIFDLVEPLLRETPNLKTFAHRYDQFRRNNPSLEELLIPDVAANPQGWLPGDGQAISSRQALGELRNLAAAVERGDGSALSIDLNRGVAVALFGHGIAQQGFKVSVARKFIDAMTGRSSATHKRQVMADMLGYDPSSPLIPIAPALAGGVIQTGIQETQ